MVKKNLIYFGMLFSMLGMLFFEDQLWLKYFFLGAGIIIILLGIGIKRKDRKRSEK